MWVCVCVCVDIQLFKHQFGKRLSFESLYHVDFLFYSIHWMCLFFHQHYMALRTISLSYVLKQGVVCPPNLWDFFPQFLLSIPVPLSLYIMFKTHLSVSQKHSDKILIRLQIISRRMDTLNIWGLPICQYRMSVHLLDFSHFFCQCSIVFCIHILHIYFFRIT